MPTPAKPIRYNMGRVEFLACMEEIEALLAQGFSKRMVYERLTKESRISMAYITFCKLSVKAAKGELQVASLRPAHQPAATTLPLRQSQPNVIKSPSEGLQDPRKIDPKSVF